jgi:predicted CopG family antitoxin
MCTYYGHMGAKTIALDQEAYSLLKAHRKPDESFSALVKRHFRPAHRLADFAGAWSDLPAAERKSLHRERDAGREADRRRAERVRSRGG